MYFILIFPLASLLMIVMVLWFFSSGKTVPFTDQNGNLVKGSISEKIFVTINGVEQGMFIKGKDTSKPVLLFLHGGPGMPEYAISRKYPLVLENLFTVCWWEQRGAGLSFSTHHPPHKLTFDQLIADTREVTNYLRHRFEKDKIYLMAHSGGSFTGMQAVAATPELYHAYITMAQITNQMESEKLAYHFMVGEFTRLSEKQILKKFEQFQVTQLNTPAYYKMRDAPMHTLGIGTTRKMKSVINGIFLPIMLHSEYTLGEKINIWRGKFYTTNRALLWQKLVDTDLTGKITEVKIPVYFFHGLYDYTVSYDLAKQYFNQLKAPMKGFYTFSQSAHSPLFEEPETMQKILHNDVLKGLNNLRDTSHHIPFTSAYPSLHSHSVGD